MFETRTCRRQEKLNINLENCAFRLCVLHNYITMPGAKNSCITRRKSENTHCEERFPFFLNQINKV